MTDDERWYDGDFAAEADENDVEAAVKRLRDLIDEVDEIERLLKGEGQ